MRLYSCLLTLVCLAISASSANARSDKGVVLVLVPGLSLSQARRMPVVSTLLNKGSSAVMSARVGRELQVPFAPIAPDPLTSGYFTMACGSRMAAGSECSVVVSPDEAIEATDSFPQPAGALWASLHGKQDAPSGLVAPYFQIALRQALAAPYEALVGGLAAALQSKGLGCEVAGNADSPDALQREAALFVLFPDGTSPRSGGEGAGALTIRDARFPFGVRTSIPVLLQRASVALKRSAFVVIETGDPARFQRYQDRVLPAARQQMQTLVFSAADKIVAGILKDLPSGYRLLVASPGQMLDPETLAAEHLPLIISYRPGEAPGLLSSSSTRRPGVVANTDVASSIANWLGVPSAIGSGREMRASPQDDPAAHLAGIQQYAHYQEAARPAVYGFVYLSLAAIVALAILFRTGGAIQWNTAALFGPAAMAGLLLATPLRLEPLALGVVSLGAGGLVAFALPQGAKRPGETLAVLVLALGAVAFGMGWFPLAAASYQIQGGARYYGIGNEYSGLLVGAVVYIACSPLIKPWWLRFVALVAALGVMMFLGLPRGGANAGDMLGGLIGCCVIAAALSGAKSRKIFPALVTGAVLLLLLFAGIDALRPAEAQSHLGRAMTEIVRHGPVAAVDIARRKLELNLMLLRNSPWALLLVAECGAAAWLVHKAPKGSGRLTSVRTSALVAAVVALFALNDSGVLSAAAAGLWLVVDAAERPGEAVLTRALRKNAKAS